MSSDVESKPAAKWPPPDSMFVGISISGVEKFRCGVGHDVQADLHNHDVRCWTCSKKTVLTSLDEARIVELLAERLWGWLHKHRVTMEAEQAAAEAGGQHAGEAA